MIFCKRGTPDVICLPDGPVGPWQKRRSAKARARMATVAVGGSVALAGCTTFGTNVSGDFSCRAPDGTCAPSMVIDDRALAMITGGSAYQPAGPYPVAPVRSNSQMASLGVRQGTPAPIARTDQKVLTVIFPAHVDARGRLYEATTVRTVVDNGSWSVASATTPVRAVGLPRDAMELGAMAPVSPTPSPGEGVADPALAYDIAPPPLLIDPDLPSAEAVADARARGQSGLGATAVVTAPATSTPASSINVPRGFAATVED